MTWPHLAGCTLGSPSEFVRGGSCVCSELLRLPHWNLPPTYTVPSFQFIPLFFERCAEICYQGNKESFSISYSNDFLLELSSHWERGSFLVGLLICPVTIDICHHRAPPTLPFLCVTQQDFPHKFCWPRWLLPTLTHALDFTAFHCLWSL